MTNKEAIGILKYEGCCVDCPCSGYPDCEVDNCTTYQALDLAINALEERPTGKWHHSGECNVCHKRSYKTTPTGEIIGLDFTDFCKNCGADMREQSEGDDNERN